MDPTTDYEQPAPPPPGLPSDVRGWAIGAHLGGVAMALVTMAMLGFLAPLVVWLSKRDDHPFIEHHAKEALNFQLTVLVAIVAAVALAIPTVIVGVLTLGVGLIIAAIIGIAAVLLWLILPLLAAVAASNGEGYRYPFTIRFIR